MELYYLQSRWYDPFVGRFINADEYVSIGYGTLGWNMFAYTNNNPVNYEDPDGFKKIAAVLTIIGTVAFAFVGGFRSYRSQMGTYGEVNWWNVYLHAVTEPIIQIVSHFVIPGEQYIWEICDWRIHQTKSY